MLERFLDDLGRELARDHARENVQARLIEAELHLREGIEARLELGMGFTQAQREALEAFGQPVVLAQGERPSARPRLASITAAYALFVLMFFSAWWAATSPLVILLVSVALLLWAALAMAFAVNAFRSRRSAPRSVFATGCAASFAVAVVLGSTTIPRRGAGLLPRSRAFAARSTLTERLARRVGEGDRLFREVDRLDRPNGIESFRVPAGFHVPLPNTTQGWGPWLAYHDVADAARARNDIRDAWRGNGAEVRQLREGVAELDEGMVHPIQNLMATAPEVATYGVALAALATFADLFLGATGALALRRRSRKGPLGA